MKLVDISIVLCLLCGGVSIPLAAVVGNKEPIASISFFTGIVTFSGTLVLYVRSLYHNTVRAAKRAADVRQKELIAKVVQDEFEKLTVKSVD